MRGFEMLTSNQLLPLHIYNKILIRNLLIWQRKRGSTESVGMYAVQCCECHKWRTVPTKDEFETIRENFTADPWICSKRPDCSCEDPADIEYGSSRIWIINKPNMPKPPHKTERLVINER